MTALTLGRSFGEGHSASLSQAAFSGISGPSADDISQAAPALIGCIGVPGFALSVLEQLQRFTDAGCWSAYVLDRDAEPSLVASATREQPDRSMACWQAYTAGLYRQDQTFDQAWRANDNVMSHWTAAEFRPAHRTQIYETLGALERLSIVAPLDRRLLTINMYRMADQQPFSVSDAATAARLAPVLFACVKQQLLIAAGTARHTASISSHDAVADAGRDVRSALLRACPRLTDREIDVAQNLLLGRTYEGIAAHLQLSAATVKTYRERAFRKLGIRFRNELYSLVMSEHPTRVPGTTSLTTKPAAPSRT